MLKEDREKKKIAPKIIVIILVWLTTLFIVLFTYEFTSPPDASGIGIFMSTIFLVIIGIVVQSIAQVRYVNYGLMDAFVIGTIVPIVMGAQFIALNGSWSFLIDELWFLVKWVFIPCYSATFISYYLTEIGLKS